MVLCPDRYGWHFPELTKIIDSNIAYAKAVRFMGARDRAAGLDFSGILDEEVESQVKEATVVSMGTEISVEDLSHVASLCDQVVELSEYRAQLYEYLKNRMQARPCNTTPLLLQALPVALRPRPRIAKLAVCQTGSSLETAALCRRSRPT